MKYLTGKDSGMWITQTKKPAWKSQSEWDAESVGIYELLERFEKGELKKETVVNRVLTLIYN